MKKHSKRWKRFRDAKDEINLRTFTLSQAIGIEKNKKDFSYNSEAKILTLIYEHVMYQTNYSFQSKTWMGPLSNIGDAIAYDLLESANYDMKAIKEDVSLISEACQILIGHAYFCFEIDKSIAILTNHAFITKGYRREMILDLLRVLKSQMQLEIKYRLSNLAPIIYPVPMGECSHFMIICQTHYRKIFLLH